LIFSNRLFLITIVLFSISAFADFTVPRLRGPVNDYASVVPRRSEIELQNVLSKINQSGKAQLAILTVKSLGNESIEEASIKVVDQWKLGDKQEDNGVLILLSTEDRKVRIEVGQGLEGVIPDVVAKRIIEDNMIPLFRSGDIASGLFVGTYLVTKNIDSQLAESLASSKTSFKKKRKKASLLDFIFGIIFILIIAGSRSGIFFALPFLGGGRRYRGGGGFGGGFGGGGFGGGGFGGGGGGFSGGGASGGW